MPASDAVAATTSVLESNCEADVTFCPVMEVKKDPLVVVSVVVGFRQLSDFTGVDVGTEIGVKIGSAAGSGR